MEWSQIYSETPMIVVGRRMCATDATGAPKQRSGVAYLVVASL